MIKPDEANQENFLKCFGELCQAIPKSKRALFMYQMCVVEIVGREAFRLLKGFRQYILETPSMGGEQSPFVQQIDTLLPRAKPEQAPATDTSTTAEAASRGEED